MDGEAIEGGDKRNDYETKRWDLRESGEYKTEFSKTERFESEKKYGTAEALKGGVLMPTCVVTRLNGDHY